MTPCERIESATNAAVPPLIAVVDDDASFLRSVGRLLGSAGFRVETFNSPHLFLASLHASTPRCLLLDVHMPEMTGFQLHDRLEALGRRVPVVFVTAYDTPQTREYARQAGGPGLLLKPFGPEALLQAIRSAIG